MHDFPRLSPLLPVNPFATECRYQGIPYHVQCIYHHKRYVSISVYHEIYRLYSYLFCILIVQDTVTNKHCNRTFSFNYPIKSTMNLAPYDALSVYYSSTSLICRVPRLAARAGHWLGTLSEECQDKYQTKLGILTLDGATGGSFWRIFLMYNIWARGRTTRRCVCETRMPPRATRPNGYYEYKGHGRWQGHWPCCHLKGVLRHELSPGMNCRRRQFMPMLAA